MWEVNELLYSKLGQCLLHSGPYLELLSNNSSL